MEKKLNEMSKNLQNLTDKIMPVEVLDYSIKNHFFEFPPAAKTSEELEKNIELLQVINLDSKDV